MAGPRQPLGRGVVELAFASPVRRAAVIERCRGAEVRIVVMFPRFATKRVARPPKDAADRRDKTTPALGVGQQDAQRLRDRREESVCVVGQGAPLDSPIAPFHKRPLVVYNY